MSEPIGYADHFGDVCSKEERIQMPGWHSDYTIPLYTHPMRELSDEEIREIGKPFLGFVVDDELEFARAILKKASEK